MYLCNGHCNVGEIWMEPYFKDDVMVLEKIVFDWSKIFFFSGTKINRSSMNLKMQQEATGGAKWVKEGSPNENADRC